MARDDRPNLDVSVKVQTTTGNEFELKPTATSARNRIRSLSWRTKLGEGFSDGGCSLPRRVDQDHPDLGLMDIWTVVDDAGDILYQGRAEQFPRTLDETHQIGVTLVGLMKDAQRRKFAQVFVDRSSDRWEPPSLIRRVALAGLVVDSDYTAIKAGGVGFQGVDAKAISINSRAELIYRTPNGVLVSAISYNGTQVNTANVEAAALFTGSSELSIGTTTGLTLDGTLRTIPTLTVPAQYAMLRALASGTHTPAAGFPFSRAISKLAVYGDHGLTTYPPLSTGEPNGVRATDAIKYIIDNFCPSLSSAGVQDSSYVVPHLEFTERVYPFDAFLQINKYLLWKLAVWEDGKVVFEPHDLTDYTWQIRTDDPNVSLDWQGPSTSTIYNGASVSYTDILTGVASVLTPDDTDELADTDPENPFNKAGIQQWLEVAVSTPQLQADAAAIGRAELAEANRPKAPGMFTVQGHIRDRAGNWQHVGKVRSGQTIALTNHPNSDPRLIVETDYQDDSKQVRIATDLPFNLVEAIMDRVDVELQATGLRR